MEFQELITQRYSVRAYKPDDVSSDKLDKILEAAQLAPTANIQQCFALFVIKTFGCKEELKNIYDQEWFIQAPYVIGICGIPEGNWIRMDGKNYNDVDSAISMDHLILSATALGLGTCWVGDFDSSAARKFLALPLGMEPIAFTPIGYPANNAGPKKRKSLDKLVRYIK